MWSKLSGGIRAKKILQGILYSRRVAGAYLFVGFDPEAKLVQANLFTQALLCEKKGVSPCGECRACTKFKAGKHPDFISVCPEGATLKIDQIRELKKLLHYGPSQGEYLVVLINPADSMTIEAANSFLKSLEEPAPGIVFVLLAEREEKLPLTITSRCQRIVFEEEVATDLELEEIIQRMEQLSGCNLVERLDFAEELLGVEADLKHLLLNLIAGYSQKLFAGADSKPRLLAGLVKLRLLFDAYRRVNLNANKRLVLENVLLKWGE